MVPKRARESESGSPSNKKVKREAEHQGEGLEGLKVVITGETELLGRSVLEAKLKTAGAVLTSAVSGVTNLLIYGPKLEDGRPTESSTKYKKGQELIDSGKSKVGLRMLSEAELYAEFPEIGPSAASAARDTSVNAAPSNTKSSLWAERWRPVKEADFTFNFHAYSALKDWLANWSPKQERDRACLLTGPPGVGKTSSAIAVCANQGYELIEMNASDTRSKKRLQELHPLIWGGCTLTKGTLNGKLCLLMDEADGLSSGDRGGSDELCRMIKVTAVPIIATCNDKQHPKVKTLGKYCRVIDFPKPDCGSAVARCLQIARAEGQKHVTEEAVKHCYTASNGDMRFLIHSLQALTASGKLVNNNKDEVSYDDAFAVTRKLIAQAQTKSPQQCLQFFFFDYDMVPLVVQENCPKTLVKNNSERTALQRLAKMCDSISVADKIMSRIRERNQWDLLPDAGFFGAVIPAKCSDPQHAFRMDFPGVLGRISARNKKRRQLCELRGLTGHNDGVSDGLFELLGDWLLDPLAKGEDVDNCLDRAAVYRLTNKEVLTDTLMNVRHKNSLSPFDAVPSKTKLKLTKAFQAREIVMAKKGGKKAKGGALVLPPDTETTSDVEEEIDIVDSPPVY